LLFAYFNFAFLSIAKYRQALLLVDFIGVWKNCEKRFELPEQGYAFYSASNIFTHSHTKFLPPNKNPTFEPNQNSIGNQIRANPLPTKPSPQS